LGDKKQYNSSSNIMNTRCTQVAESYIAYQALLATALGVIPLLQICTLAVYNTPISFHCSNAPLFGAIKSCTNAKITSSNGATNGAAPFHLEIITTRLTPQQNPSPALTFCSGWKCKPRLMRETNTVHHMHHTSMIVNT
jgi:hypothetical protein